MNTTKGIYTTTNPVPKSEVAAQRLGRCNQTLGLQPPEARPYLRFRERPARHGTNTEALLEMTGAEVQVLRLELLPPETSAFAPYTGIERTSWLYTLQS